MLSKSIKKTDSRELISMDQAAISLDTRRCHGCGKCVRVCPQGVLELVGLPFHRHARIQEAEKCTGCLRCVQACPHHCIQIWEGHHAGISG